MVKPQAEIDGKTIQVDKRALGKANRQLSGQSVIQTESYPEGTLYIYGQDRHYTYTEEISASHSVRHVTDRQRYIMLPRQTDRQTHQHTQTNLLNTVRPRSVHFKGGTIRQAAAGTGHQGEMWGHTAPIYPCNINISKLFFWEFIVWLACAVGPYHTQSLKCSSQGSCICVMIVFHLLVCVRDLAFTKKGMQSHILL